MFNPNNIQYQLATDAQGSEVVTVTLTDDGGTDNGGDADTDLHLPLM